MPEQATATTKGSRKSLKAAAGAWRFIQEDFAQGHAHKALGKPIVWSCALVEKEIYYSMGLYPFYPEQYSALAAVRRKTPQSEKDAVRFAKIAEQHGYSTDLCGYHRVIMGYVINGDLTDGPLGGMPAPDVLVTTSSVCDLRLKWWEDLAQRLKVPMFTLDRPERIMCGQLQTPKPYEIDYYRSQLQDCFSFISEVTGAKCDQGELNKCLDWAYKTNEVRLELMELRKAVPSPMGSADSFATVYPAMYCSGTEKAYRFYVALRDEVKARAEAKLGQIENERFRLLWAGIPTWFNTGIFNYFEPMGGVFAFEPVYHPYPWPARNPHDPISEMALRTLLPETELVRGSVEGFREICQEYQIDGLVYNSVYTCRPVYLPVLEAVRMVEEELGVPSVVIDCDLVDERSYSEGQVRTRLDALAERIAARKGIRL
jgi:benzoyl-CoA reductase/2-hydroxyglutaryl-CoA dehydratase subunit BcrC/BadD/HgdB